MTLTQTSPIVSSSSSSSCSLQPANGTFSSKGSSSPDELLDSAALQTKEPRRKEHANLHRKQSCIHGATLLIPGRHAQRSSVVIINRLNAHAGIRENAFSEIYALGSTKHDD